MAKALAVMAQIVAGEQGYRRAAASNARLEDTGQRAVKGADPAVEIGLHVGLLQIKLVLRRQVVAAFGHGKGDDFRLRRRALRHQRGDLAIPGKNFADGGYRLVGPLPFR